MKNFKVLLMVVVFFSMHTLQAEDVNETAKSDTCTEPETDDKLNSELLNTLPAVNILNLSGKDCDGLVIDCFIVHTLPNSNTGTLYLANAETEVVVGQYLSLEEADGLRFDPNENFEGNTTFTYCSVDSRDVVDATSATVTIPIVAPVVGGGTTDDRNDCDSATDTNVTHNVNCTCEAYEASISSLSTFGSLLMFILSILIVRNFIKKEI